VGRDYEKGGVFGTGRQSSKKLIVAFGLVGFNSVKNLHMNKM
jgi:hypothetical protein